MAADCETSRSRPAGQSPPITGHTTEAPKADRVDSLTPPAENSDKGGDVDTSLTPKPGVPTINLPDTPRSISPENKEEAKMCVSTDSGHHRSKVRTLEMPLFKVCLL